MARKHNVAQWETWDWTKQDVALSEQHGVSRERVRQIRKLLNRGDSYNKRRRRKAIVLPCSTGNHVAV